MGGRGAQGFRASTSISQAEKVLSRLTGNDAHFKGIPLNTANAINEALKNVYDRFKVKLDIREIKGMKKDDGRYMEAGYRSGNGSLWVKTNINTWPKRAEKFFSIGWLASKDKYGVLYHEFGHAYWEQMSLQQRNQVTSIYRRATRKAYLEWMRDGGSENQKTQADYFRNTLSRYAHESNQEFFAEAFSQIMSGRMRPVSREVLQIISDKGKEKK